MVVQQWWSKEKRLKVKSSHIPQDNALVQVAGNSGKVELKEKEENKTKQKFVVAQTIILT